MKLFVKLLKTYLLAVLCIAVATALRIWPLNVLGDRFIWSSFYPAVVLSALYGGLYPGLFATFVSCLIAYTGWHYFSDHSFSADNAGVVGMLVFVVNGVLISAIAQALKKSRETNARASRQLEEKIAQLNALSDHLPDSFTYQSTAGSGPEPEMVHISNGVGKFIKGAGEEIVRNQELLHRLIWHEDRDYFIRERDKAKKNISEFQVDVRFNRPDGTFGWATIHSKPRQREDGIYVWDGLFTDITQRVNLERELTRQQLRSQQLITEMAIQEHEEEKNQVSYELHEQINQLLAAAKMNLDYIRSRKIPHDDILADCILNLKNAIEKINLLFESIDAPTFDMVGLGMRIESLADEILRPYFPLVSVELVRHELDQLPEKIKLLLYRIVKNRLNFIRDHVEPCAVEIAIAVSDSQLQMSLNYTGPTFEKDPDKWSMDLRKIRSRVEFYGGTLRISSGGDGTCQTQISLPLGMTELPSDPIAAAFFPR